MRFVRRAELRWLPSRHHFALFRLVAFLGLSAARRKGFSAPRPDLLLFVDRNQSALETWSVAVWITATTVSYAGWLLAAVMPLPLALGLAVPAAAVALELPLFACRTILVPLRNAVRGTRMENNQRMNGVLLMLILAALSVWYSVTPGWIRIAAWLFMALLALNAMAAVALFFLRAAVRRLEEEAGGGPSGS